MRKVARISALFLFSALGSGCATRTETFDINIHNSTPQAVTITLSKASSSGQLPGPYESTWASPEEVAILSPREREWWDKQLVPPGGEAWMHHVTGQFNADTRGVLRCYSGNLKVEDVLARGKGSPDRVDVPLTPGRNEIILVDRDGQLRAVVEQNLPPPR